MPEAIQHRINGMPVFASISGDRNSPLHTQIYKEIEPQKILKQAYKEGFTRAPSNNIIVRLLDRMNYIIN